MNLFDVLSVVAVYAVFMILCGRRSAGNAARWSAQTQKSASIHGIALRRDIAERVREYVRWQLVLGAMSLGVAGVVVQSALPDVDPALHHSHRAAAYVAAVLALPLLGTVLVVASGARAWNKAPARRVAHLNTPRLRNIFTAHERAAVALGVVITVASGWWGLAHLGADSEWWLLCLGAFTANGLAWRCAVRLILARPARAGDDLELCWDDLLRHKEARELTIGAAWIPAATTFWLDWIAAGSGNLLPFYAWIAVAVALALVFREGRHLWSQAWGQPGPA